MPHALLLVDHGSRRAEANDQLACVADLTQHLAGPDVVVTHAHMELAAPDIRTAFRHCVEAGADHVVVMPYFLFAGRHVSEDIPRLVAAAASAHPDVSYEVVDPIGAHPQMGRVILDRAGLLTVGDLPEDAPECSGDPRGCEAPYCGGPGTITDRPPDQGPSSA